MNFESVVGANGTRVMKTGFLLNPTEQAFRRLPQAVDAAIIILFPLGQLLTFQFFLQCSQARPLRCQLGGEGGIAVSFVPK